MRNCKRQLQILSRNLGVVYSWDTINNRNAGRRKLGDERDILVTGEEFAMEKKVKTVKVILDKLKVFKSDHTLLQR